MDICLSVSLSVCEEDLLGFMRWCDVDVQRDKAGDKRSLFVSVCLSVCLSICLSKARIRQAYEIMWCWWTEIRLQIDLSVYLCVWHNTADNRTVLILYFILRSHVCSSCSSFNKTATQHPGYRVLVIKSSLYILTKHLRCHLNSLRPKANK